MKTTKVCQEHTTWWQWWSCHNCTDSGETQQSSAVIHNM